MKPYYSHAGIAIYHGDAREILPDLAPLVPDPRLAPVDVVLTDPPYGIDGGRGGVNRQRAKGATSAPAGRTPQHTSRMSASQPSPGLWCRWGRVVLTPGKRNIHLYPPPDDVGCFYCPSAPGWDRWGQTVFNPILYYGEDPRAGKGQSRSGISLSGITVTEGANVPDFPCPKPPGAWKWLLNKASLEGETVLDPFMGSGTTLVAAKRLAQEVLF